MFNLELTLAILKPHIVANPIAHQFIKNIIVTSNFKIVRSKIHKLSLSEVEKFYQEHEGNFFYNRLITFMTSGKSHICILAKENAIKEWRKLMGPTKVFQTQYTDPNSIRGMFGLSDTRNVTHGSDSIESTKKEIGILFPDFNIETWYKEEEKLFRDDQIKFIENKFIHVIIDELTENIKMCK